MVVGRALTDPRFSQKEFFVSNRTRFWALLALLSLLAFMPSRESHSQTKKGVVYVCACMKDKSCWCMTEAKTEGPCACGTKGGPPLKAVSSDSNWAKTNREELAK